MPPYLVFREAGASPATMGKFSVSGWLKMLTLEGAIEGNINTVDGGIGLFIHSSPFPLTEFLSFQLLSPFPHSERFSHRKNFRPRYFSHTLQRGGRQELS